MILTPVIGKRIPSMDLTLLYWSIHSRLRRSAQVGGTETAEFIFQLSKSNGETNEFINIFCFLFPKNINPHAVVFEFPYPELRSNPWLQGLFHCKQENPHAFVLSKLNNLLKNYPVFYYHNFHDLSEDATGPYKIIPTFLSEKVFFTRWQMLLCENPRSKYKKFL